MKFYRLFVAIAAVFFMMACLAYAGADDMAKQANKIVRDAERNMFNGKNEEADGLLKEAATLIDQVKAADPENKSIVSVERKYKQVRKNLDKKLKPAAAVSSGGGGNLPQKPETNTVPAISSKSATTPALPAVSEKASGGAVKLPGGVSKRLRDIGAELNKAERYLPGNVKQAQYILSQANNLFQEIDQQYSGQFDPSHPDYSAAQERYDRMMAEAAGQEAAEEEAKAEAQAADNAREKQSREWISRFQAYLSSPGIEGHNPDLLVFVPGTSEPEKFGDAYARYEAFKAFYEEYKNTDFPAGRTDKLIDLAEKKAPAHFKYFEEGFSDRVESITGYAEKEIDDATAYLERDNGWKSDSTVKPYLLDHKRMSAIQGAVKNVNAALPADDPTRKRVLGKFETLAAKDKANREIRKQRTFMKPDRYKGKDIKELKNKAESLVKNDAKEGGTPLRTTLISENWDEQTVEEWTDTAKTTWRRRITRSITAQVAARTSDGVRCITVALAKDKQSDGSWGPLYGNLHQYSEPMLEANVQK
jgi:hypothetical protein